MNEHVTIDGEIVEGRTAFVAYLKAMNRAQARIEPIRKTANNAHFKSRYADLGSIIAQVGKILSDEGLVYWFEPELRDDGKLIVWCCLAEATAGYVHRVPSIPTPMPAGGNPFHVTGSATTYLSRYSFGEALGIALVDDDDGNAMNDLPPARKPVNVRALVEKIDKTQTMDALGALRAEVEDLPQGSDERRQAVEAYKDGIARLTPAKAVVKDA